MDEMPVLETTRLFIRPFRMQDLSDVYRLFDQELNVEALHAQETPTLQERSEWLQWSVLNTTQLAKLNQPPYGDRAIVLKNSGELVGSCGYAPCLGPYWQLHTQSAENMDRYLPEVGIFYAISPSHQRHGFATEAAQALIDYAFQNLQLKHIIATTHYDNAASVGVMRKLGMQIVKNPGTQPFWLQVVGVLENKAS